MKIGDRILIIGKKHPWKSHTGEVLDRMQTLVGIMWRVRIDNGMEVGVKETELRKV